MYKYSKYTKIIFKYIKNYRGIYFMMILTGYNFESYELKNPKKEYLSNKGFDIVRFSI